MSQKNWKNSRTNGWKEIFGKMDNLIFASDYQEAIMAGDANQVRSLILSGADLNQRGAFDVTPIFCAIFYEKVHIVEMMVQSGADLNVENSHHMTPLAAAIQKGNVKMIKRVLDLGADIHAPIFKCFNALHLATYFKDTEVIKLLIERGLDINSRDHREETPLHSAVKDNSKKVVEVLLALGADVSVTLSEDKEILFPEDSKLEIKNITPLLSATMMGHVDIAGLLLKAGADANGNSHCNLKPLHQAITQGSLQLVNLLIKAGCDVNARFRGGTPLSMAIARNQVKIVDTLLKAEGIEVNQIDDEGKAPLLIAATIGNLHIVEMLISKGVPINDISSKDKVTALHGSIACNKEQVAHWLINNGADVNAKITSGHTVMHLASVVGVPLKILRALIKNGANIHAKSAKGRTPMHDAAIEDNVVSVRFLVDQGADPNERTNNGITALYCAAVSNSVKVVKYLVTETGVDLDAGAASPLYVAVQKGHQEIVRLLLYNGADVNTGFNNETPLHAAAKEGNQVVTELLLRHSATLNTYNTKGQSPLFFSVENNHDKIVRALLDKGADPNAFDDGGCCPIHIAVQSENIDIVQNLLNKGAYYNAFDESADYVTPLDLAHENGNAKLITMIELVKKLFRAVSKGDFYQIECCIQAGAILNARCRSGKTALHSAIKSKNLKAVEALLAHGAELTLTTDTGTSSLHYAIAKGNARIIATLLHHARSLGPMHYNFYINAVTVEEGLTSLHVAALKNNYKAVKLLIEHSAVYNAKNTVGKTPCHLSTDQKIKDILDLIKKLFESVTKCDESEVSKIILSRKSLINARDSDEGRTPLMIAILKDHSSVAKFLLISGADHLLVTNKGASPLFIAASKGNLEIVQALLSGAKSDDPEKVSNFVNALTENGSAALHVSTSLDIVRCLLQEGATYNARNASGKTPHELTKTDDIRRYLQTVDNIFESMKKETSIVINSLAELGEEDFKAVTSTRNEDGQTLLQVALANRKMVVGKKLLERLKNIR